MSKIPLGFSRFGNTVIHLDLESCSLTTQSIDRGQRTVHGDMDIKFFDYDVLQQIRSSCYPVPADGHEQGIDRLLNTGDSIVDAMADANDVLSSPAQWSRTLRRTALLFAPITLPTWLAAVLTLGAVINILDIILTTARRCRGRMLDLSMWWTA